MSKSHSYVSDLSTYFILAVDEGKNEIVVSENDIGIKLTEDIHISKKKKKHLIENFNTLKIEDVIKMIEFEEIIIYTVKELSEGYYVGSKVLVKKENNKKYLINDNKDYLSSLLYVDEFYLKYAEYIGD